MTQSIKQHVLDVVIRALKTFVQAALPLWGLTNFSISKSAVLSAVSAGISAVWNVAIKLELAWAASNQAVTPVVNPVVTPVQPVATAVSVTPGQVVSPTSSTSL